MLLELTFAIITSYISSACNCISTEATQTLLTLELQFNSKKSLYTSGMHYLKLGALGSWRWAVLLGTPHSHRSIAARF